MDISAARLIPDENLDLLFTGFGLANVFPFPRGAILGEKIDGSKTQKEGGAITGGTILGEKTDNAEKKRWFLQNNNIMVEWDALYDHIFYGHNHDECIKDPMDNMMELFGLDDGPPFLPVASELELRGTWECERSGIKELIPTHRYEDVLKGFDSPARLSPPASPRFRGKDNLLDFAIIEDSILIESPKRPKAGIII